MKITIFIIAISLCLFITTSPAATEFDNSGNATLNWCEKALMRYTNMTDAIEGSYCVGYVRGFAEAVFLINPSAICIPENVTTGQMVRIYVNFVKENPARLHEDRTILLAEALVKAFPCKK